jgi:TetR/AcrR family transcriptional repressor of nem operon
LAPEIARAKVAVRRKIAGLIKERRNHLLELMPGATATERERNFYVIFSAMAGAVSAARILTEPADRQRVLQGMQDHLLRSF